MKRYFYQKYDQVELDPHIDCYGTLESDESGIISFVYPYDKSHLERMSVSVATALIMREVKRLISVEVPDYDGRNTTISVHFGLSVYVDSQGLDGRECDSFSADTATGRVSRVEPPLRGRSSFLPIWIYALSPLEGGIRRHRPLCRRGI